MIIKQFGIFLSIDFSHASFIQNVDSQIKYPRLQQICQNLSKQLVSVYKTFRREEGLKGSIFKGN